MDLTNEDVADILALLDSLPYESLDVETPRFRLTLRRAAGGGWTSESEVLAAPAAVTLVASDRPTPAAPGVSPASPASPVPDRSSASGAPAATGADRAADGNATGGPGGTAAGPTDVGGLVAVVTPLPGTFYRAPRPGAPPFVEVGDAVTADGVVAIVETMKLMNSVHAGTAGRVARICLDNGEFAPLGTTLILIEPEP
jgi:acetyl-CoA carboxylase biotin carboxyl carrier protein